MGLYTDYLAEIEDRKKQDLHPKPIEDGALVEELIAQIKDTGNQHYQTSLNFLIYNTLPGTTSAAGVKAQFLKSVILNEVMIKEITPDFAFELLSQMKGGPSIEVLLDLAVKSSVAVSTLTDKSSRSYGARSQRRFTSSLLHSSHYIHL